MNSVPEHLKKPLAQLLLSIADDKLILGHRNSDWTGLGPILEEDIAFSHLAQDELAHAQALYEFVGGMIGKKADELAFGRTLEEYRCAWIVEVPDDFDWATALCRQFFCDHFDRVRLGALSRSSHKPLADLSRRIAAEEQIHVEHSDKWMIRLGRGGDESHQRMRRAFENLTSVATALIEPVDGQDLLVAAGVFPVSLEAMFKIWSDDVNQVLVASSLLKKPMDFLKLCISFDKMHSGRHGVHSEHLKPLLDEMCEVYRMEPGAAW